MKLSTNKFSLIEMLICLAIIMFIISILLPGLLLARDRAAQVNCMSQQKQIYAGISSFSESNDSDVPKSHNLTPPFFYRHGDLDGVIIQDFYLDLKDHMDVRIWACGVIADSPGMTTRTTTFGFMSWELGDLMYFGGRKFPEFGDVTTALPGNLARVSDSASLTIAQCVFVDWVFPGGYMVSTHGRGSNMPLNEEWVWGSLEQSNGGTNAMFYDGHVSWNSWWNTEYIGLTSSNTMSYDPELAGLNFDFGSFGLLGGRAWGVMPN